MKKNDDTSFNRIMAGLGEVVDIVEGRASAARVYVPEDVVHNRGVRSVGASWPRSRAATAEGSPSRSMGRRD
jgi:hypothetical protein